MRHPPTRSLGLDENIALLHTLTAHANVVIPAMHRLPSTIGVRLVTLSKLAI
jgi:hypothetical protein